MPFRSEKMETNTPESSVLFSWTAPQYDRGARSALWYVVTGTTTLALLVYSFWSGAWSFGIVLVLMAGLYAYLHEHTPAETTLTIRTDGVQLGNELTPWSRCKGFWFLQDKAGKAELHIEHSDPWKQDIVMQVGEQNPYAIRGILLQHLEEFPHRREKFLDMLVRICRL